MSDELPAPPTDEPFNAGDPRHVGVRAKDARRREKGIENVTKGLMSSSPGRAWVWGMLEVCGVFRSSFNTEPLEMARREGERNIGLMMLADVTRAAPDQYIVMIREQTG